MECLGVPAAANWNYQLNIIAVFLMEISIRAIGE